MVSFILSILFLIFGYLFYGRFIDKSFRPDARVTPAVSLDNGVDYVALSDWKVFLIQILNIAGTGPIFGALSGALFGPIVYLWIILGCVFAGGVHDYLCGMMSLRHNGDNIPVLTGMYLGKPMKHIMSLFSVILLIMTAVVFTSGPAGLLAIITPDYLSVGFWTIVITLYYFIATFVPIDKIIGKFYPVFGICLLVMAVGVGGNIILDPQFEMPEIWNNFENRHPNDLQVWPFMFITVACGAVSGFHATQSPIMARCCRSELSGRKIFYGAMICEGIIALIWAAAGVSCYESSQALLDAGAGCSAVVYYICNSTMGKAGCFLAMLGVIACPVTSGDTAYRSARLTLSEWFNYDQSEVKNRLFITVPLLLTGTIISQLDYTIVWRYFSWANQTLAAIVLWTASVYLVHDGKKYLPAAIPATFMTAVTLTYFLYAPECLGGIILKMGFDSRSYYIVSVISGILTATLLLSGFLKYASSHSKEKLKWGN